MDDSPLKEIAAGATYGALEWSLDKIKEIAYRIKHTREIAIVNDSEAIRKLSEEEKKEEYKIYCRYIDDKDYRVLVKMGIYLRRIQEQPDKIKSLRDKIIKKYHTEGLHIAQFVQNGILLDFINILLEQGMDHESIKKKIIHCVVW